MGIINSDVLEFDTDKLSGYAGNVQDVADNLAKQQKKLTKDLAGLREDWQTDAGKAFFEKYDDAWVRQLDGYIEMLGYLVEALEFAAERYGELEL